MPFDRPPREFVILELGTDDGVTGVGLTFFGGPLTGALHSAVDALAALAIGEDPLRIEAIVAKLRKAAGSSGPGGIFTLALAAIDIALWDMKGKVAGLSVHSLLGGSRDRAPTYASGVLMGDYSEAYLAEAGPSLVELGFRQMKTHLGLEATVEAALRRIRILRDGIGDDIELMCDANQAWSVNQAIDMGRRLEPFRLFWLEDLIVHDDFQGLARVADALATPIASGEYHYGIRPFRHMLEAQSIDIVMIDTLRAGGITPWIKIAAMAEAFNISVVSHLFPEINVHLIAAVPNGLTIEYMPSTLLLFEETPEMVDGQLVVPDRPGLGLEFDQATIEQYQVG
jgi:L-alanine-DL-glutamate epimerase-like enolase superfamily enzyme